MKLLKDSLQKKLKELFQKVNIQRILKPLLSNHLSRNIHGNQALIGTTTTGKVVGGNISNETSENILISKDRELYLLEQKKDSSYYNHEVRKVGYKFCYRLILFPRCYRLNNKKKEKLGEVILMTLMI